MTTHYEVQVDARPAVRQGERLRRALGRLRLAADAVARAANAGAQSVTGSLRALARRGRR